MQSTGVQDTFTIKLPQFEGPFDLLLFFIERDELDIYNIPIATITDDFLAYIHGMDVMNVDLASEFILVSAQLMSIKARMLIPRKQLDETGELFGMIAFVEHIAADDEVEIAQAGVAAPPVAG